MKLEVKYLFTTSSSGAIFFIHQLSGGLELREKKHMVLGCKRIKKSGCTFSGFLRIFLELCGFKIELAPPHVNFSNGDAKPEIVYTKQRKCTFKRHALFYKRRFFSTRTQCYLTFRKLSFKCCLDVV